jgi:acetolactate synthase I/II/III large subunit
MGSVVEAVALALKAAGVTRAWGMPGGDTLPLIAALAEVEIPFHLVRDEASAGFAADATAQLTGTVGVAVATIGPGMTNLISGVAGALLDRAPLLAITSRYRSDRHGIYTHMMLDQDALMRPTAKAWVRLTPEGAALEVRRALAIAKAHRAGPVWVEIPTEVAPAPSQISVCSPPPQPLPVVPDPSLVARVAGWERPVVLVGFDARHAPIQALAERLRAPVFTTFKAKGALREGQGWAAGPVGYSPRADGLAAELVAQADGLLLIGWDPAELRDQWLPGWDERPQVVVVDRAEPTDLPTRIDALHVGDPQSAVSALIGGASRWLESEVSSHRQRVEALFQEEDGGGAATMIRAVQAGLPADAVACFDVGAHRITGAHVWRCARPDTLLQSSGLASMGYGIPAGLAAAAEGRPAVVVTGDMGLQMAMGELMTAAENGWRLVVVVVVDDTLSLIALKQERLGHPSRAVRFANPNWEGLAASVGGVAEVVYEPGQLTAAVARGLGREGVTLVAAQIDPSCYRGQM